MFEPFAEATGVEVADTECDGSYALVQEKGGAGDAGTCAVAAEAW